jgi:RNA polymerase sigma factor (sigma-70 family)
VSVGPGSSVFVAVYERTYGPLVRTATAIVGTRSVAEEVVQDAFAAMWRHHEQVANLEAYVRRAVVNGCRSHLRRHSVRLETSGVMPEIPVDDEHHDLVASIRRLKFRQRAVLVMRYYDGLSDGAIAEALAMRPSTVRSTAARALRALKEVLADDE